MSMIRSTQQRRDGGGKSVSVLMGLVASTLAVMSSLHLSGVLLGRSKLFQPHAAGIAEAVIGVVLAAGAIAVWRAPVQARPLALAATGFAIFGFLIGLAFTVLGGDAVDIAYHAIVLPLLTIIFLLLRRRSSGTSR